MLPILQNMGVFAALTFVIDLLPLAMAFAYAFQPSERRLALMRPLSLAALFGAMSCTVSSIALGFRRISIGPDLSADFQRQLAMGFAEALAPTFVGFACLTASWLLVASRIGSWRSHEGT